MPSKLRPRGWAGNVCLGQDGMVYGAFADGHDGGATVRRQGSARVFGQCAAAGVAGVGGG